jgi:hypothetical protein
MSRWVVSSLSSASALAIRTVDVTTLIHAACSSADLSRRARRGTEGDYEGTQFGFAFGFLIRFVNAVEVGVA